MASLVFESRAYPWPGPAGGGKSLRRTHDAGWAGHAIDPCVREGRLAPARDGPAQACRVMEGFELCCSCRPGAIASHGSCMTCRGEFAFCVPRGQDLKAIQTRQRAYKFSMCLFLQSRDQGRMIRRWLRKSRRAQGTGVCRVRMPTRSAVQTRIHGHVPVDRSETGFRGGPRAVRTRDINARQCFESTCRTNRKGSRQIAAGSQKQ